jgi:hypothetical protein
MKSLNLQPYGVVEMSQDEIVMAEGGSWKIIYEAIRGGLIYDAICACFDFISEASASPTNVATQNEQQANMMRGH